MGKHDKHDAVVNRSSEEFLRNENAVLRKKIADKDAELAFANETIRKLQEQCSRMSKWASEIEAGADDKLTELEAENAKLRGKIVRLVESYV